MRRLLLCLCLLLWSVSAQAVTFDITSPQGIVSGDFNIVTTVTPSPGAGLSYVNIYVDGNAVFRSSRIRTGADVPFTFDYLAKYGYLACYGHGQHTLVVEAQQGGIFYNSGPINFSVDRTPTVTITSPGPSVYGGTVFTGTVTVPPNRSSTKGWMWGYLDGELYSSQGQECTTIPCSFSYTVVTSHGPHELKMEIDTWGLRTAHTTSVSIDQTPVVDLVSPERTAPFNFDVTGTVTYAPNNGSPSQWGIVTAKIDGVKLSSGDYQACQTNPCEVRIPVATYSVGPGPHVVTLEAHGFLSPTAIDTDDAGIDTETIFSQDCPRGGNVCWGSTANVIAGTVSFDLPLFQVGSATPGATDLSLIYDSGDVLTGGLFPLGAGWTHSYALVLFTNPDGSKVLRGGGVQERFYTPNGPDYLSEAGDSSLLEKLVDNSYRITERSGRVLTFSNAGKLTSITDRFGNVITVSPLVYHKQYVTDPNGRVTTLNYATNDTHIVSVQDPAGNLYSFGYNTYGLINSVTFPSPGVGQPEPVWTFLYDPLTRMMTYKTDPKGQITWYGYDGHRIEATIDPEGVLDTSGTPESFEPEGHSKALATAGSSSTVTRENGATWSYGFDAGTGLVNSVTDPAGFVTETTYTSEGWVDTRTEPVDADTLKLTDFGYDSYGNVTEVEVAAVHLIRDTEGNIIGQTQDEPLVHRTMTYDYADNDRLETVTDLLTSPPAVTTVAAEDLGGYRVITITDPYAKVKTIRLNPDGTVHDVDPGNGAVTTYGYDSAGRLSSITDPLSVKTELSGHDNLGNPSQVQLRDTQNAVRQTLLLDHDNLSRLVKTTLNALPANLVTEYGYDALGNLTSTLDANNHLSESAVNFRGQPTLLTDAAQNETALEYGGCGTCGGNGQLTALTDASENRTEFQYDALGRLVLETDPQGQQMGYEYRADGQLIRKFDVATSTTLVSYEYDILGRITSKTVLGSGTTTYTYRADGLLGTATNSEIGYTLDWWPNGWLKSVTDSLGQVVSYDQYDGAGQRTLVKILPGQPNERVLTYGYTNGRLASIGSPSGTFSFTPDTLGRLSTLGYPNGVSGTYSYQADTGWLTGIDYDGTGPVLDVDYTNFDAVGNRLSRSEDGVPVSYDYDVTDQVIEAGEEDFTYDATGNRTSGPGSGDTSYSYVEGNEIVASPWASYTHDDRGNRLTGGGWTYTWNGEDRLVSASNGTTTMSFGYDPFGRRVRKTVDAVTTRYLYDAEDIVLETTGGVETFYVHGPGIDQPLALVRGGASTFYHADGLGSIVSLTNSNQAEVQRYGYSAFGQGTAATGFSQPYGFTGRELDAETGLMYYRARYYDPQMGRWLSRDPIGFEAGDVNLLRYVGNSPTGWVDPWGEAGTTLVGAEIGGIFGGPPGAVVGAIIGTGVGIWLGDKLWDSIVFNQTQRQIDHDLYKARERSSPPNGLDECELLKWELKKAKDVRDMRQAWDDKWQPGRHANDIANWNKRVKKLEKLIKERCGGCP